MSDKAVMRSAFHEVVIDGADINFAQAIRIGDAHGAPVAEADAVGAHLNLPIGPSLDDHRSICWRTIEFQRVGIEVGESLRDGRAARRLDKLDPGNQRTPKVRAAYMIQ